MSYTLRFPICLAPGGQISNLDKNRHKLGNRSFRFLADPPYVAILVDGFRNERSALAYIPRLRTALYWAALEHGLAYTAELRIDKVVYHDDPVAAARNISKTFGLPVNRVDGMIRGHNPCVYPTGTDLVSLTPFEMPSLILGTPFPRFITSMKAGLSRGRAKNLQDDRLHTALALYCARFHEQSDNARFLALIMALEVLTEKQDKADTALVLMRRWSDDVAREKKRFTKHTAEYDALESLEREVLFRKEASVRSKIRRLVGEALSTSSGGGREKLIRRAVELYDLRGTLVHEGKLPAEALTHAIADAGRIASLVLKSRLGRPLGVGARSRSR